MNKCPQCDYSLEGLPEEHTCPECGLEYDADMSFIRLRLHRSSWTKFVNTASFVFLMAVGIRGLGVQQRDFEFIILLGILLAWDLLGVLRSASGDAAFILNRNGVQLVHPKRGTQPVAWPQIKHARYRWLTGTLVVIGHDEKKLISLRRHDAGGMSVARNCAVEINRLAHIYANR